MNKIVKTARVHTTLAAVVLVAAAITPARAGTYQMMPGYGPGVGTDTATVGTLYAVAPYGASPSQTTTQFDDEDVVCKWRYEPDDTNDVAPARRINVTWSLSGTLQAQYYGSAGARAAADFTPTGAYAASVSWVLPPPSPNNTTVNISATPSITTTEYYSPIDDVIDYIAFVTVTASATAAKQTAIPNSTASATTTTPSITVLSVTPVP